jgi:hypothetical protein
MVSGVVIDIGESTGGVMNLAGDIPFERVSKDDDSHSLRRHS